MPVKKEQPFCACTTIHNDVIHSAAKKMLKDETVYELSDFFKMLGDSTRIKILRALSLHEMCVCDLSALLEMNQSAVSHQLKTLKSSRLVKFRRDGKVAYYSLADDHVVQILNQGIVHINEKD